MATLLFFCGIGLRRTLPKVLTLPRHTKPTFKNLSMDVTTDQLKRDARSIFAAGVDAVLPHRMVAKTLSCHGNCLTVSGKQYKVDHNVYVVGFGKAVIGMVGAVDDILGEHIQLGVASVPFGIQEALKKAGRIDLLPSAASKVTIIEGAKNNLPDSDSQRAAERITELTEGLGEGDLLIVLVSGGGSALLPAPTPPITLQDVYEVSRTLARRGCTIAELNTIRKHLSRLKGGRLGQLAYPAQVISLILSDIIGNQLDMIASGPTIRDDSTPQDCLDIISSLGAADAIPKSVFRFLQEKVVADAAIEKPESASCDHVLNLCIGHNEMAAEHAKRYAEDLGYAAMLISTDLSGEARKVGEMFVEMAAYSCESYNVKQRGCANHNMKTLGQDLIRLHGLQAETLEKIQAIVDTAYSRKAPICLIGAGETTVAVTGKGRGGRNQEMSLAVALAMKRQSDLEKLLHDGYRAVFLSAGTDGQDGPTDAAGALADPSQVTLASQSGIDAETVLKNNDSYSFYSQLNDGKDLLKTGLTGTNVMDLQVLLVLPPDQAET
ncbi:glycerate kinase-like isoform X2 [Acanthaster planci]|nr:glycerate kinase-like isoform X2 [Acanthaster planci]XP_022104040.1 glycerate kinase-like isoform X2 [Acanthaster planci]XP_022104041.1 glycerate kinase-like isoform X2 [Acanthaster planci]